MMMKREVELLQSDGGFQGGVVESFEEMRAFC